jgi:hypothetical protein
MTQQGSVPGALARGRRGATRSSVDGVESSRSRPGTRVSRLAVAALALAVAAVMVAAAQAPARATLQAAVSVIVPTPGFGVSLPGVPTDLSGLRSLSVTLGRTPDTVMWYAQWSSAPHFPASRASAIAPLGAVPEVTWEPWNPVAGVKQPSYSLAVIAAGAWDGYLRQWAKDIRSYGGPVRLRFGHEMNGNWYPWAEGVNGNAPGSYAAAWRHVHDVFRAQRVANVRWVWSPNVPYSGSTPLARLWPGDGYVDEVALDGYNWSRLLPWTTWTGFAALFDTGLAQVAALTSRPVSIGEVASTEVGGDKAAWISDMFVALAARPQVRGFTWFDWNKETDWRVDSTSASLAAFRAGLASYPRPGS